MSQLEAFKSEVETFLARSQMSPTRLGVLAVKDPSFVRELRKGRAPNMTTADRVLAFIRNANHSAPKQDTTTGAAA